MLQTKTLYDTDFQLWLEQQSQILHNRRYEALDVENLLEELISLGKRDRRSLESYLEVLFTHLLKWEFQPEQRSGSWRGSISNSRLKISKILRDSPSLKNYIPEVWQLAYEGGRRIAADETELAIEIFPELCPYHLEQALDLDFLPGTSEALP
jgi:hypothetical protein